MDVNNPYSYMGMIDSTAKDIANTYINRHNNPQQKKR